MIIPIPVGINGRMSPKTSNIIASKRMASKIHFLIRIRRMVLCCSTLKKAIVENLSVCGLRRFSKWMMIGTASAAKAAKNQGLKNCISKDTQVERKNKVREYRVMTRNSILESTKGKENENETCLNAMSMLFLILLPSIPSAACNLNADTFKCCQAPYCFRIYCPNYTP